MLITVIGMLKMANSQLMIGQIYSQILNVILNFQTKTFKFKHQQIMHWITQDVYSGLSQPLRGECIVSDRNEEQRNTSLFVCRFEFFNFCNVSKILDNLKNLTQHKHNLKKKKKMSKKLTDVHERQRADLSSMVPSETRMFRTAPWPPGISHA